MARKDEVDFDDWTFAGKISGELAKLLGWKLHPRIESEYVDEDGSETGFFTFASSEGHSFDPANDVEDAMVFVQRACARRQIGFKVTCRPDGMWVASFEIGGGATGMNVVPSRAICEAGWGLRTIRDPNQLFRKSES